MNNLEFNVLYSIKKYGINDYIKAKELVGISINLIENKIIEFNNKNWINNKGITNKGLDALSIYKVDNAIIMAAGMSSRFVPLSLEKPKGLLKVKGEILIERQIKQLIEAGIKNIIIVVGYKKEEFFYLIEMFDNVKIIINSEYNKKNNTHTIYLAQDYLKNSYICSSDNYFSENPFDDYVYESYYSSIYVDESVNEWYIDSDNNGYISKVNKSGNKGFIMLGHAFWNKEFSNKMINLLNEDSNYGSYNKLLWEDVFAEHLDSLPKMKIKVYPENVIFEFDSLDELRNFDKDYLDNTNSKIMNNIVNVFQCKESDVSKFKPLEEGKEYISFTFEIKKIKYVYDYPRKSENFIVNEERKLKIQESNKFSKKNSNIIFINQKEGWKISLVS